MLPWTMNYSQKKKNKQKPIYFEIFLRDKIEEFV